MKLLQFYFALVTPLMVLILISKNIPSGWFVAGLFAYVGYNLLLCNSKLKRKGYHVGFFAHLNPFNRRSQELYHKVYFEQ